MTGARLSWPKAPTESPEDVGRSYAGLLRHVPEVLRIWAEVDGLSLRLYTLVRDDRAVEEQVYDAEQQLRDAFPKVSFRFEVLREGSCVPAPSEDSLVLYDAAA